MDAVGDMDRLAKLAVDKLHSTFGSDVEIINADFIASVNSQIINRATDKQSALTIF